MPDARQPSYTTIVGTGAIGAGVVFRLEGDHDLGRNESRRAALLDQRDYFKLHIILHYVARLLGQAGYATRVYPIGAVGEDANGARLLRDMRAAGMDLRHVRVRRDAPTLFGICYVYPDGSGGNLSPTNGASGLVDTAAIREAEPLIAEAGRRGLVLAAPEVPLETRAELLGLARRYGAYTAASYVSGELAEAGILDQLRNVDLLALNLEEAASLGGCSTGRPAERIIEACVARLGGTTRSLRLSVSNGRSGAYAWEAGRLEHLPSLSVRAACTAGAGDAMLAGYIIGLVAGLPFLGATGSCFRLARLLAAMSVTSPDTINFEMDLATLRAFAAEQGEALPL